MRGLATLRRFVRTPAPTACGLCGELVGEEHEHLLDPKMQLLCCCPACAILFDHGDRYRRVPRRRARRGRISPQDWASLGLPVNLVTLVVRSSGQPMALYPGPGGTVERELEEPIALLEGLEPEVEGILVHDRECYQIPIDEHFRLIGGLRRGEPLSALLQSLEARCD